VKAGDKEVDMRNFGEVAVSVWRPSNFGFSFGGGGEVSSPF
jgi:hypothetical protein